MLFFLAVSAIDTVCRSSMIENSSSVKGPRPPRASRGRQVASKRLTEASVVDDKHCHIAERIVVEFANAIERRQCGRAGGHRLVLAVTWEPGRDGASEATASRPGPAGISRRQVGDDSTGRPSWPTSSSVFRPRRSPRLPMSWPREQDRDARARRRRSMPLTNDRATGR